VSLHRVDPRFVLPHAVRRAVVLGGLQEWRAGLVSAGIDVSDTSSGHPPPDVVVSPARFAAQARDTGASSIIVEGARERTFRGGGYRIQRFLLRPTRERPTLALPLDQSAATSYALERWSVVDRRWKAARLRAARHLVSRGWFPSWASPVVTVATRTADQPALVAAAAELGVTGDVSWFLTFGQGDALSRNAFQLFRADSRRPEWVLKFARVAGYSERFDNDERGLQLAHAAGEPIAAHAPQLLGRFEIDGVHASLETAAAGRRLRDLLLMPGDRGAKLKLIERIADWILALGRLTQTAPDAQGLERRRLRGEVVASWSAFGVEPQLVEELPPLSGVLQHNDLGTWNVVSDDGDFVVVDWENVRQSALPLWDLLYFLGDAFVLLDGSHDPERLPMRIASLFAGEAPSSPLLFSWVRRAAETARVPLDAVGPIATLCWLSHSLSARAHNVELATFTPRDPPRLHGIEGIGRVWLAHPALGPHWRAWRR
jgi:Phosphotransferase enzyme family